VRGFTSVVRRVLRWRACRGRTEKFADQIAAKLGIEKTALIRVRAGIFALAEAMDDDSVKCGRRLRRIWSAHRDQADRSHCARNGAIDRKRPFGTTAANGRDGGLRTFANRLADDEVAPISDVP